MDNCTYNKIKVLRELALVNGFVQRHCPKDAKAARHGHCHKEFMDLQKDLDKHTAALRRALAK